MASPHVAGIVALILSQNNNATLNDVRNTLQSYAIDIAESGKDETTGYGLIQGE
jgi:subtilisin family serine protease